MFFELVREVRSVVYLDDEASDLEKCKADLAPRAVHTTSRAAEVFELVEQVSPDLILVDYFLGDQHFYAEDGSRLRGGQLALEVVRRLRAKSPTAAIVIPSGGMCGPLDEVAKLAGANAVIHKLLGWKKIVQIVEGGALGDPHLQKPASLKLREHEAMVKAYIDNDFNATKTAEELDITRSTLYRKLKNAPLK